MYSIPCINCFQEIKERPRVDDILRCRRRKCKGKFCKSKISTLVARDTLLVCIPTPSTHSADPSAALRASAKSGQALLRTGFAGMTVLYIVKSIDAMPWMYQTKSQASTGIQCGSFPSHLTLQPMGLVSGTLMGLPAKCSSSALSRSLVVILLVLRGLSTPRPV